MRYKNQRRRHIRATLGVFSAVMSVILLTAVVYAVVGELEYGPHLLSGALLEVMILTLMSASLSLELRCGGLDFSLGAVAVLSPCFAAYIFSGSITVFSLLSLFFGALLGLISAGVRVISGLSCALCSLCMCLIYEGILFTLMSGNGQIQLDISPSVGGYVSVILTALICASCVYMAVERTVWGAGYRAMSKNKYIAEGCGVDIRRSAVISHIISGALMGLSGALICTREGRPVGAGLSFASVRILFFGLLPLLWGRIYSYLTGEAVGDMLGVICSAVLYSALRVISESVGLESTENLTALVSGGLLLIFLAFLSNKRSFFVRIRTKDRPSKKI